MRTFSIITITQLVREVQKEGLPQFSRTKFYRMVRENKWPLPPRTQVGDKGWRNFGLTDESARFAKDAPPYSVPFYKALIKQRYGFSVEIPPRPAGLKDFDEAEKEGLE